MGRTINHTERISNSFDALTGDSLAKPDIVAELFTRLDASQAAHAMTLMTFWCKRQAREAGRANDTPVPPLMERHEVETAGALALAKTKGPTQ